MNQKQPCAGRNCGSTNPNLHSAECFEDYEKSTGMAQQKPVAWKDLTYGNLHHQDFGNSIPLYTRPQAREWVGLTNEEIAKVISLAGFAPDWAEAHIATQIVRVLEAKLREKNA